MKPTGQLTARVTVQIVDPWHPGSGRSRGHHIDAAVVRGRHQLPYLPARHLRGLLRYAASCLDAWQEELPDATEQPRAHEIFGRPGSHGAGQVASVTLTNAELDPKEQAWFLANAETSAVESLYFSSFHTAIDSTTGTAKKHSLRGVELIVPMTLYATLEVAAPEPERLVGRIQQAAGLVRAVGGWRSRGFGRAAVKVELGAAT